MLPAYDELTFATARLEASLRRRWSVLTDRKASADELLKWASLNSEGAVAFVGHGDEDCWYTAPGLGSESPAYTGFHDVLVNSGKWPPGRFRVLGYACASAVALGTAVVRSGGQFVGFEKDIFFAVALPSGALEAECVEAVEGALDAVANSPSVGSGTAEELRQLYEKLWNRAASDRPRVATPRAVRLRLAILSQLEGVCGLPKADSREAHVEEGSVRSE